MLRGGEVLPKLVPASCPSHRKAGDVNTEPSFGFC